MTKICKVCNTNKSLDEFSRHNGAKDGRRSNCKSCHAAEKKKRYEANPDLFKKRNKTYSLKNPEKMYADVLKRTLKRFRLSPQEYSAMLAKQHGLCPICNLPPTGRRLSVDHSHKTGKVRELLCQNCNSLLGFCLEDVRILRSAIGYLEKHK